MTSLRNVINSAIVACSIAVGGSAYAHEPANISPNQLEVPDIPRKSSLLEATIWTGLPALVVAEGMMAYENHRNGNDLDYVMNSYRFAFTNPPVWDTNPWYVNYVGHPLTGSEFFLVARNRGYSFTESFLYSTAGSVAWEYALEPVVGAKPSIQDLMFTSTMGSALGELRYEAKKRLEGNNDLLSKILVVILDPIDAVWNAIED